MYLLEKIIDKCERSSNDWRRGACGGRTVRIEQSDYDKYGKKKLVDEAAELEKMGYITIKRWEIRGSDVDTVAYRVEDLPRFYDLFNTLAARDGRKKWWAKQEKADYYVSMLEAELNGNILTEWIRAYYGDLMSQFKKGKFPVEENALKMYFACFRGISELDRRKEPMYKRVFSKRYLKNSKKFENEAEGHIVRTARRYWSEIAEEMDGKAVLAQMLIEDYSSELAVKGPLKIEVEKPQSGGEKLCIDMGHFIYGGVLNSAMLKNSRILTEQPGIRRVITIENKANFVSAPYDDTTLYIFSHGYFSPGEREFLVRLREVLDKGKEAPIRASRNTGSCGQADLVGQDIGYYHSGDLDYGGIKIYEYIKKRIFPQLKPYQMDAGTFDQYIEYAEAEVPSKLEKLRNVHVPELEETIRRILDTGLVIEQESFLISQEESI